MTCDDDDCVSVVLLRGCWLDGTNKCLKNGAAEVRNITYYYYYCLRSRPVSPNVVRSLVSPLVRSNVETKIRMTRMTG